MYGIEILLYNKLEIISTYNVLHIRISKFIIRYNNCENKSTYIILYERIFNISF